MLASRQRTTRQKIGAGMSSISFRKPEFRLHLGYPTIFLTHGQRTLARLDAAVDGLHAGLAEMAAIVTGARGRLIAVLPEEEVTRTRLDLAGRGRAERRASARIALGGRLGVAPEALSVVIGRADAHGSFPVAGVRRTTLAETRALLATVGLRPVAIVGAGLFPGFPAAPRLGGGWALPRLDLPTIPPERRGLAAAAGAGAVLALALLAFSRPAPTEPLAAVETSQAALVPAVVAVATPAAAPVLGETVTAAPPAVVKAAELPSTTALLTSPPPPPRPATLRTGGGVTLAARNMPADLPVRAEPEARPLAKLAAITAAAPARALEAIAAPLRRPADKSAPEKAVQKPVPAADVAAAARVAAPTLRASAVPAELRPLPRPGDAARSAGAARPAADKSASVAPRARGSDQPAMLVASLEPAPLMQASIAAASAATLAAVLDEPPPARPEAPKPKPVAAKPAAAKPAAKPATVAAKSAAPKPVVARPQPVEVRSLVQQATPPRPMVSTTPQPKIAAVPTTPQPRIASVSTTPQPKVVAVKPVQKPVITAAPEPVRQKTVRAPAPQRQVVAMAAPAALAAPAPVRQKLVQKPVPVRQAAKPAQVRTATNKAKPWAPEPVAAEKPRFSKPTAQRIGLTRGNVSLVGVFAGADGRRALVRLPNGDIERVKVGDKVQGVQIAAINEDSVQVAGRGGRNTLLRLPD